MIPTIIADDEPRAITALQILLDRHCKQVNVIAVANNINDAFELISKNKPSLIFLDINMPHGSGLELLAQLKDNQDVKVIFTTAYQEYAVKAFRMSAIDYLLKPVDKEELIEDLERYRQSISRPHAMEMNLLNDLLKDSKTKKMAINTADSLHMVEMDDILYLKSERNYTHLFFQDSTIVASKSLGEFEDLLTEYGFLRIHRSCIVNLFRVKEYRKRNMDLVLHDGTVLEVSRNRKEQLAEKLQNL